MQSAHRRARQRGGQRSEHPRPPGPPDARARAAFACSSGPAWRPHTRNHRAAVGSGQSKPLASLGARADLWLARPSRRLRPQQRAADPSDQGSAQPPSRRVRPRAPAPVAGASGRPLFSNRSGVLHSAFGSGAGRRRVTWLLTLWRAKVLSLSVPILGSPAFCSWVHCVAWTTRPRVSLWTRSGGFAASEISSQHEVPHAAWRFHAHFVRAVSRCGRFVTGLARRVTERS